MAKRRYYPAPKCPRCGKEDSWVSDTRYTSDEIIRMRRCGFCDWKWWTRQFPEESIDPAKERIKIPSFKNTPIGGPTPPVRVVPVD